MDYERARERYTADFDELVDTTIHSIYKTPYEPSKSWSLALDKYLKKTLSKYSVCYLITKYDIEQELAAAWLSFVKEYNSNKPKIHIRQYLIRRSIWFLRDWIAQSYRQHYVSLHVIPEKTLPDKTDLGFKLDVKFLLYGTDWYPLSLLSPYERYLIFLQFVEERSLPEISYIVQKDRFTVTNQIKNIIGYLRSKYVKQEDTNGSCY